MNRQVYLDEDYWEALTLMAKKMGMSRQALVQEFLVNVVKQNPTILEEAQRMKQHDPSQVNLTIELTKPMAGKTKIYRFTKKNGEVLQGSGMSAGLALNALMGRKVSVEEFDREYLTWEEVV